MLRLYLDVNKRDETIAAVECVQQSRIRRNSPRSTRTLKTARARLAAIGMTVEEKQKGVRSSNAFAQNHKIIKRRGRKAVWDLLVNLGEKPSGAKAPGNSLQNTAGMNACSTRLRLTKSQRESRKAPRQRLFFPARKVLKAKLLRQFHWPSAVEKVGLQRETSHAGLGYLKCRKRKKPSLRRMVQHTIFRTYK